MGRESQLTENAPVERDVLEASSDGHGDGLTEGNAETAWKRSVRSHDPASEHDSLGPDASAARSGGSQLGDVQGANDGGAANTNTEDQTARDELAEGERRGHDDGTSGEAEA